MNKTLFEYSTECNQYSSIDSAANIGFIFLPVNMNKAVIKLAVLFLDQFKSMTVDEVKDFKDKIAVDKSNLTLGKTLQEPILQQINSKLIFLGCSDNRRINYIHSLIRVPEWFMYSESYLKNNISSKISSYKQDINAIAEDMSKYPYRGPLTDSLLKDLDNQEPNILKFIKEPSNKLNNLNSRAIRKVTAKSIKQSIETIIKWIEGKEECPGWAMDFVSTIQLIRQNVEEVNSAMMRIAVEGFNNKDLTRSMSMSAENDLPICKDIVAKLGWGIREGENKIPAALGNIFHFDYNPLQIPLTSGQIDLSEIGNCLYANVAPGLGPCYKIRYVFCTFSELQSLANIPATFLKKYHISCYHHAYLDQTGYIKNNVHKFTDVQCTDITGYSDYLNRNIYKLLMRLYGFNEVTISMLWPLFTMNVRLPDTGEIISVPYGALQGVAFIVFIMNDANALIGLIQNLLRAHKWDCRQNAGDDVFSAKFDGKFTTLDLEIDIMVWLYFNCPTNMSKTAWLNRDGYWDFCKTFYTYNGKSITGLPPKSYMKQLLNVRDVAELYKVLDRCTGMEYNSIEDVTADGSEFREFLDPNLKIGMTLPNRICKLNLEDKIKVARSVPYKLGGWSASEDYDNIHYYIALLHSSLTSIYSNYLDKDSGFYILGSAWNDNTEIKKFLTQVKDAEIVDYLAVMSEIDMVKQDLEEEDVVDRDIVNDIIDRIDRMSRSVLYTGKVGRSSSTYHRLTPVNSADIGLIPDSQIENSKKILMDDKLFHHPENVVQHLIYYSLANLPITDNISKLRSAISLTAVYNKYDEEGRIVMGGGGNYGNAGSYLYLTYNDDRVRLYASNQSHSSRNNIYNWDEINLPEEDKQFCRYMTQLNIGDIHNTVSQAASRISKSLSNSALARVVEHYHRFTDEKRVMKSEDWDDIVSNAISSIKM